MRKKYIWETLTITESQVITSDCADIYFWNIGGGGSIVNINGVPLASKESMTDGAWGDELNVTLYQITFPIGSKAILVVKRKKYAF